ncbi:hypothetical protein [Actinopolymorpha alba]|uniref:hypothetical protein n=1 Tax=Actinopolymorpha alba TaxID=533267 RepID=UPI0003763308|nr:hypothetical protein [Actinopolymorpha alba]
MPRQIIVDHVEELLDILHDANRSNAFITVAQCLKRFHSAVAQPLLNKALARAVGAVHA